jgi:NAD(P)-dependent dehydrogenase (short-subunit alcohol dehydrogenase family)
MKKVVLITGTSTGLGLSTSIIFAKKGFKVYATMRNLAKQDLLLEAAKNANVVVHVEQLDVTDTSSIEICVGKIIAAEGKIDILINNAGAGFVRTTEQATEEEIVWVTDVNYHGVVRCCKAVLPYMRKARSGHIINITSVGGLVGQPFNELYCAAKFAVEGYTEAMACYLTEPFGIKFSMVEPGGISSDFSKSVLEKVEKTGGMLDDEYLPILQKYIGGAQRRAKSDETDIFQTSEEVAQVVLEVGENENPPLRIRTSKWSNEFCHLKTGSDPDGTKLVKEVIEQFL